MRLPHVRFTVWRMIVSVATTALALDLYVSAALMAADPTDHGEQDKALAEILDSGGTVKHDADRPNSPVVAISLLDQAVTRNLQREGLKLGRRPRLFTDEDLARLRGLSSLLTLDLTDAGEVAVTDAGLTHLAGLPSLQDLNLGGLSITDAGLSHLSPLRDLKTLRLSGTRVSGKGLVHLQKLKKLESLDLGWTPVDDTGLGHLEGMTGLRSLSLDRTKVTDKGLRHLRGLSKLDDLDLSNTRITDDGLSSLVEMESLSKLTLFFYSRVSSETRVTDSGLRRLAGIKKLRFLNIRGTAISAEGIERFKKNRPDVYIFSSDSPSRNRQMQCLFYERRLTVRMN